MFQCKHPSGHMMFIQRRLNVNATSWRCIDVEVTLYLRYVPTGIVFVAAIGWCSVGSNSSVHDVTVNGRKQGVTVKFQDKPVAW